MTKPELLAEVKDRLGAIHARFTEGGIVGVLVGGSERFSTHVGAKRITWVASRLSENDWALAWSDRLDKSAQ